jgi:4-aminobutyrate aminotransferase
MSDVKRPRVNHPLPGPNSKAVIDQDEHFVSPSYTRDFPVVAVKGEGCWIHDPDGNMFLDFCSGLVVTSTGHCHPEVVKAIQDQAEKLIHMSGTDFYYPTQSKLAKKLAEIAPGSSPKKVFYTNSGTEAIEGAIKLARAHTRRHRIIAFFGAFHGRTYGSMSLTASKVVQRRYFAPLLPGIHHIPYGYCYRCPYNLEYPGCKLECVDYLEDKLFKHNAPPEEVAAVFVEPIQGEGGYVVPPPDYHQRLKALCEKHGILFVMDEIQSGFGRTGKMFASEHYGIEPDIICMAKGIASGMPLGAIVAKADVMDWEYGSHASTYGGNPIACAAALKVIELLEGGLIENSAKMGEYLMGKLKEMQKKFPVIGDIRGKGLMVGLELIEDQESMKKASGLRNRIVNEMVQHGVILIGCGENTLRFAPPLIVTKDEIDVALEIFEQVLEKLTAAVA